MVIVRTRWDRRQCGIRRRQRSGVQWHERPGSPGGNAGGLLAGGAGGDPGAQGEPGKSGGLGQGGTASDELALAAAAAACSAVAPGVREAATTTRGLIAAMGEWGRRFRPGATRRPRRHRASGDPSVPSVTRPVV